MCDTGEPIRMRGEAEGVVAGEFEGKAGIRLSSKSVMKHGDVETNNCGLVTAQSDKTDSGVETILLAPELEPPMVGNNCFLATEWKRMIILELPALAHAFAMPTSRSPRWACSFFSW